MRVGSPPPRCDHYQDALVGVGLPGWWGARHARRMYNATTSTFASHADPQGRLHGPRQPAAAPPPPRSRAGVQRPWQLPAGARPAAGQSRAAGQRAWHHHYSGPPPAGHRRRHSATSPADRRPHAAQQHRPAADPPRGGARLRILSGIPDRSGDDPTVANHQHRQRAWRAPGHGAGPARPTPAPRQRATIRPYRAIQQQTEYWDSTGYFAKRLASAWLGWSEAFQAR